MRQSKTRRLTTTAMLLALGLVLPFLTGQIPQIGRMLCPMHIPVFLCGLICGWPYGIALGFALPLLRGALFGMPALFPNGIAMAFELAAYGLVSGLVYFRKGYFCLRSCYVALITAMIAGRVVWGLARCALLGFFRQGWIHPQRDPDPLPAAGDLDLGADPPGVLSPMFNSSQKAAPSFFFVVIKKCSRVYLFFYC